MLPAKSNLPLDKVDIPRYKAMLDETSRYIKSVNISDAFGNYITEALALFPAGMPRHSFSLVFDGDPIPDRSKEKSEVVKRDAAWQTAL